MDWRVGTMVMYRKKLFLIFVLCISLFLSSCSHQSSSCVETDYNIFLNEVPYSNNHMPYLHELGNYESISITSKTTNNFLWADTYTISLIVEYDETSFINVKKGILEQYTFLEDPNNRLLDCEAESNGFNIKVVEKEEFLTGDAAYYYPKYFLMIGINDGTNQIAYLFHHDFDLDTIKNLDQFIETYYVLN